MATRRNAALRVLAALLLSAAALWVAAVGLILYAGSHDTLGEADAVLVLGAAQYNGRPSPVYKARIDHAIGIWQQGLARHLIFTGGVGVGDTLSEGEVGRRYAIRTANVPDSLVLVERNGVTSAESMGAAAALMRANGLTSAIIVSDSYHMLRLELLARRSGIHARRAPAPGPIDRNRDSRMRYVLRESVLFPATAILGGR
jgi:uncharacterized SAM-binding protein YcdF (DUF218 family)